MKVAIAADHRGFPLKQALTAMLQAYETKDFGAYEVDPGDDYPEYTHLVCKEVQKHPGTMGVLLCGTGQGMAMAANKHVGIRAALVWKVEEAMLARRKNDANVMVIPADSLTEEQVQQCLHTFLTTDFSGEERHKRRVAAINSLDKDR